MKFDIIQLYLVNMSCIPTAHSTKFLCVHIYAINAVLMKHLMYETLSYLVNALTFQVNLPHLFYSLLLISLVYNILPYPFVQYMHCVIYKYAFFVQ